MLTDFNDEQLDAASRAAYDSDFKVIIHYLVSEVTKLSLKAVRVGGVEAERISGACLAMENLRDQLITAGDIIKKRKEGALLEGDPDRDTISP